MKQGHQIAILAKREFRTRATSKPFLVTMGLLVLAILAVGPIVSVLAGDDPDATKIGIAGAEPPGIDRALADQSEVLDIDIDIVRLPDGDAAERAVTEGDVAVALIDGNEIVFHTDESPRLTALVGGALATAIKASTLANLGLSGAEVAEIVAPVPYDVVTLDEDDPEEDAKRVGATIGTLALYISILVFGQFVAIGTVEEKQNRVVEIVLTRVRPWQVLVGKVTGIGALGLLQLLLLAGAAFVSAQSVDLGEIDLAAIGPPIILGVVFWFMLGYAFYAFLYAAVGSTVSRQEDLQGAMMLPIALMLPGYFIALIAAESPDGAVPRVASMLPPWAPFVMPARIIDGAAAPWEILVAVAATVASVVALVWIGSRVYTGALLRTGGTVKMREAWRAATE